MAVSTADPGLLGKDATQVETPSLPRRIWLLVIAASVGGVSALDRQVLTMLVEPIRAEFSLSDQQLGLLTGLAFAVTYVIAAIPAARLADRWSRKKVVAGALTLWSGMTILCGAAASYWQLFFARVGVGLGEAGGSAPMQALLADSFPRRQRGLAMSVYLVGSSLGVGLGLAFTGWALVEFGWRWAFVFAGVPGLLLAPLIMLTVKERRAARSAGLDGSDRQPPLGQTMKTLWHIRSLPLMMVGTTLMALIGMGLLAWIPAFFARTHGLEPLEVGTKLGAALATGSFIGRLAGGPLAEYLGRWDLRFYLWTPILTGALAVMLVFAALNSTPNMAFTLLGFQTFLTGLFAAPMLYIATTLAPDWARATSAACAMFAINLVGLGAGPWLVGALSDWLRPEFGEESLRMALTFALLVYIPAAICFWLASRTFSDDHAAATQED
ncbi:MFS transporter [Erythrobacter alti]|uniref:spinster family MFS transporter n=1 Tax=Erythrobacter alti TaxID=1896145 RepID=UPI0030F3E5FE